MMAVAAGLHRAKVDSIPIPDRTLEHTMLQCFFIELLTSCRRA